MKYFYIIYYIWKIKSNTMVVNIILRETRRGTFIMVKGKKEIY